MAELKKINENMWEIEREGKMNVDVRIFASENLIEDMKKDNTFKQAINMASLAGVLNPVIVLPDAHQGYGACIGGVSGMDMNKGVISPGQIGYDIDCLSEDSKILSEFGYWKKIKDLDNELTKLNILDKENKSLDKASIGLFLKKHSENITLIKTKSGKEILATKEHPFYTKDGMKKIEEIKAGDEVLTYPFEGIEYEEPKKYLLISEEDIEKLDRSMTSKIQIKNKLKRLGLLPLYSDNPKIPYLIKIMGFIFGDGSISIKKDRTQIGFYGKKEDLELIKIDLEKIGFFASIYSRFRKHNLKTAYSEYEFERIEEFMHANSSSLAILLHLLGTPYGNKAKQDYNIPGWIMNSPKWHKRLFLASLFGAELSSPKTATNSGFNFYCPLYSMNKDNALHGISFVNQILALLEEFNIKSALIKNRVDELNGKKSNRIRLMIYSHPQNLINLYSQINYEYNIKKRKLANAAIVWLKQKEIITYFREKTMVKARELKKQGLPKAQIINMLSSKYSNKYFLDKAIYHSDYGRTGSRIAYCFIKFNEFVNLDCYGDSGFIWDEIEYKEEQEHDDLVYDLTINNENHNFIANGFVVSNCSIRLLSTNLKQEDIERVGKKELLHSIFRAVPSGVGKGSKVNITYKELDEVLKKGAEWGVEKGYGNKEDLINLEENGKLPANPEDVSKKAKQRGIGQLGTLGAGNHFLEIQKVEEIFDPETAKKFGLEKGQICIMIHCGSRGLGHQVASDYIKLMEEKYSWPEFDRELVNAPINSELGKKYFSAMNAAANFAFANKQVITHFVREQIKHYFPNAEIKVVYEVCHNIAKKEKHFIEINGKKQEKEVLVMRKGATRAFPGQPVLIPGSMGTASYVLVGSNKAMELSFGSTAHGAGRIESRTKARKELDAKNIKKELENKGIEIESGSIEGIVEEAPSAYKDIDEVVKVSDSVGIGKLVAKLKPIAVMKG
ncbi:MAG: RtcB family protein [Candidatus Nanoarchaeia archaeon]